MKKSTGQMTENLSKGIKKTLKEKSQTPLVKKWKGAAAMTAEVNPMSIAKALKDEHNARKPRRIEEKDPVPEIDGFDDKLDITKPMEMVKDMYQTLKVNDPTITPEVAAIHCDVRPSSVKKWLEDEDFRLWFETPHLALKVSIKSLTHMAVRECRSLLTGKSAWGRESIAKYLINQSFGKAKPKDHAGIPEDDDGDIDSDIKDITELEKKINKLKEIEDGDKGTIEKNEGKARTVNKANRHNSGKNSKKGGKRRTNSKNVGRKLKTSV